MQPSQQLQLKACERGSWELLRSVLPVHGSLPLPPCLQCGRASHFPAACSTETAWAREMETADAAAAEASAQLTCPQASCRAVVSVVRRRAGLIALTGPRAASGPRSRHVSAVPAGDVRALWRGVVQRVGRRYNPTLLPSHTCPDGAPSAGLDRRKRPIRRPRTEHEFRCHLYTGAGVRARAGPARCPPARHLARRGSRCWRRIGRHTLRGCIGTTHAAWSCAPGRWARWSARSRTNAGTLRRARAAALRAEGRSDPPVLPRARAAILHVGAGRGAHAARPVLHRPPAQARTPPARPPGPSER
jgi:hypothetical protein